MLQLVNQLLTDRLAGPQRGVLMLNATRDELQLGLQLLGAQLGCGSPAGGGTHVSSRISKQLRSFSSGALVQRVRVPRVSVRSSKLRSELLLEARVDVGGVAARACEQRRRRRG